MVKYIFIFVTLIFSMEILSAKEDCKSLKIFDYLESTIIVVNHEVISAYDILQDLIPINCELEKNKLLNNITKKKVLAQEALKIIKNLIEKIAINEYLKETNVVVSDEYIEERINALKKMMANDKIDFHNYIRLRYGNLELLREAIITKYKRKALVELLRLKIIVVTEEDIDRYYKKNKLQFDSKHYLDEKTKKIIKAKLEIEFANNKFIKKIQELFDNLTIQYHTSIFKLIENFDPLFIQCHKAFNANTVFFGPNVFNLNLLTTKKK